MNEMKIFASVPPELMLACESWLLISNGGGGHAEKADKSGVQSGEAGLTQRCGQLESALLQGLQQVLLVTVPGIHKHVPAWLDEELWLCIWS